MGTIMRYQSQAGRRGQRGAAAVEFGLIAVLLFTLLFGIIQFGIWFWAWQAGGHAAREAARYAAVNPCDSGQIRDKGNEALAGAPTTGSITWAVSTSANPVLVGDQVTVSVRFTTVDLQFFPGFTGSVVKSATSRVENVPAGGCS